MAYDPAGVSGRVGSYKRSYTGSDVKSGQSPTNESFLQRQKAIQESQRRVNDLPWLYGGERGKPEVKSSPASSTRKVLTADELRAGGEAARQLQAGTTIKSSFQPQQSIRRGVGGSGSNVSIKPFDIRTGVGEQRVETPTKTSGTPQVMKEGLSRTTARGEETFTEGKWNVTKPLDYPTGQLYAGQPGYNFLKEVGGIFSAEKSIGGIRKERGAIESQIVDYNKRSKEYTSGQVGLLSSGQFFKYDLMQSQGTKLQSEGLGLSSTYSSILAKEQFEGKKTIGYKYEEQFIKPTAFTFMPKFSDKTYSTIKYYAGFEFLPEKIRGSTIPNYLTGGKQGDLVAGFAKGTYTYVKERPGELLLLASVGALGGPVFSGLGKVGGFIGGKVGGFIGGKVGGQVGSKLLSSSLSKGLPIAMGATYGVSKTYEISQAPTWGAKGEILGKTFTEIGAMSLGAMAYSGIKTSIARKEWIKESELSPFRSTGYQIKLGENRGFVIQEGTKVIKGRTYVASVYSPYSETPFGYSMKGGRVTTLGFQGTKYKIITSDITKGTGYDLGLGKIGRSNKGFKVSIQESQVSSSIGWTTITPKTEMIVSPKGKITEFSLKPKPIYSVAETIATPSKLIKGQINFASVKAEKLRLFKEGGSAIIGSKYPAFGNIKVIEPRRLGFTGSAIEGGVEGKFDFVYSKKEGFSFDQSKYKPFKVGGEKSSFKIEEPIIKSEPTITSSEIKIETRIEPSTPRSQMLETPKELSDIAPEYVGGKGKQKSIYEGLGKYDVAIGEQITKSYAPKISGKPSAFGLISISSNKIAPISNRVRTPTTSFIRPEVGIKNIQDVSLVPRSEPITNIRPVNVQNINFGQISKQEIAPLLSTPSIARNVNINYPMISTPFVPIPFIPKLGGFDDIGVNSTQYRGGRRKTGYMPSFTPLAYKAFGGINLGGSYKSKGFFAKSGIDYRPIKNLKIKKVKIIRGIKIRK